MSVVWHPTCLSADVFRLLASRLGLGFLVLFTALPVRGHLLNMTRVTVSFNGGGQVSAEIHADLGLLLGTAEAYADLIRAAPAEQARRMQQVAASLTDFLRFQVDDTALHLTLDHWKLPDAPPEKIGDITVATMTTINLTGQLPPGGGKFQLVSQSVARIEFPVALTILVPGEHVSMTRWLELPGTSSRAYPLSASANVAAPSPASSAPLANPVAPVRRAAAPEAASPASGVSPFAPGLAQRIETAGQFLTLGFLHILPRGADHILFVLGLFFLGLHWRPLVWQTTVFTIAHTTTLGLSAYGIFSLPARVVEPLIAASIAYVAIENIVRPKLTPARIVIVFSFGLLHGLGFASSLSEIQLPRDQFFTALLSFNFGVDFGQLTIIALASLTVGWWRQRPWYRTRIVVPACSLIGVIGLFWAVQRIVA